MLPGFCIQGISAIWILNHLVFLPSGIASPGWKSRAVNCILTNSHKPLRFAMKLIKVLLGIPRPSPSSQKSLPRVWCRLVKRLYTSRTSDPGCLIDIIWWILLATRVGNKGGEAKVNGCEFSHGNTTLSSWELWNAEMPGIQGLGHWEANAGKKTTFTGDWVRLTVKLCHSVWNIMSVIYWTLGAEITTSVFWQLWLLTRNMGTNRLFHLVTYITGTNLRKLSKVYLCQVLFMLFKLLVLNCTMQ